ncbi:hypothetical protein DSUL_60220 [Desulfovibrionales bacterium]
MANCTISNLIENLENLNLTSVPYIANEKLRSAHGNQALHP